MNSFQIIHEKCTTCKFMTLMIESAAARISNGYADQKCSFYQAVVSSIDSRG
ncbi:MAG: hypothetical protein AAF402_02955 [Pseudomonadota bacterium]